MITTTGRVIGIKGATPGIRILMQGEDLIGRDQGMQRSTERLLKSIT
ncbi:hypothetical protein ACUXK4_005157 [Methylorubrum extorquens]|jgi:hypothetical protein